MSASPSPLYPLVHEEVLVETFEPGKLISTYIDDEAGKYKKRSVDWRPRC